MTAFKATSGPAISRDQLVEALARTSHDTWAKQATRDKGEHDLSTVIAPHDRERAEDTVDTLVELRLLHPAS